MDFLRYIFLTPKAFYTDRKNFYFYALLKITNIQIKYPTWSSSQGWLEVPEAMPDEADTLSSKDTSAPLSRYTQAAPWIHNILILDDMDTLSSRVHPKYVKRCLSLNYSTKNNYSWCWIKKPLLVKRNNV